MSEEISATVKRLTKLFGGYEALAREIRSFMDHCTGAVRARRLWQHDAFRNSWAREIPMNLGFNWEL